MYVCRKVNAALEEQIKTLWHTTQIYMHPRIVQYAEKLTSKLPGDLNVVYLTNSGSEANDLAILLARLYTKNYDIITLKNAYHGASTSCMGLTGYILLTSFHRLRNEKISFPSHSSFNMAISRAWIKKRNYSCDEC